MTKIYKEYVECCASCPLKCGLMDFRLNLDKFNPALEIHPDCPLDDAEEDLSPRSE